MNFDVIDERTIKRALIARKDVLKDKAVDFQYEHGMSSALAMCCFDKIDDINSVLDKIEGDQHEVK